MAELMSMYDYVIQSLNVMTGAGWDSKTIAEAQGLSHYLQREAFIVPFVISEHMLGYTKQLSINLQGK